MPLYAPNKTNHELDLGVQLLCPTKKIMTRFTTGDALFAEGPIALGKEQTAKPHPAKGSLPSAVVGHSAKALPSARTALGKENWPSAVDGVFAECRVRKALGKAFPFFLKNPLPSAFLTRHSAKKKMFF